MQIAGHITNEEGEKVIALSGKWNSHLDMVKCDEAGEPIPDAPTTRLWTVSGTALDYFACLVVATISGWWALPLLCLVGLTLGMVRHE